MASLKFMAIAAAIMSMVEGKTFYGVQRAIRRERPCRYLCDDKHRKAVDGNRANVRRMQRARNKQFKVAR